MFTTAKNEKLPDVRGTRMTADEGERLAAEYLESNGYRLVMRNFKVPLEKRNSRGAEVTGEIDIIALDGGTLCFVEVKTRTSDEFASPITAVDRRKQRQIIRTARIYRELFDVGRIPFRYDAVAVVLPASSEARIEHFKDFWNESKFRRRKWNTRNSDVF